MNKRKAFIIATICILLGIISLLVFEKPSNLQQQNKRKVIQSEYRNILNPELKNKIKYRCDFLPESKHLFLSGIYKINYAIDIYKVNLQPKLVDSEAIKINLGIVSLSPGNKYMGYDDTNYITCNFSFEGDSLADRIIINYNGDIPIKHTYGDSIVVYSLSASQLSIGNPKEPNEIVYLGAQKSIYEKTVSKISFTIALYEKHGAVYVVAVYSRDWNLKVDNKMIENFLGLRSS